MARSRFLISLVVGVSISAAWLGAAPSGFAEASASIPIEELNRRFLEAMKAGKKTQFQQRYALLAPTIAHVLNVESVLERALGNRWPQLLPEQRSALTEAFEQYATSLCVVYLDDDSGERFEVLGETEIDGGNRIVRVRTWSEDAGNEAHTMSYVMRQVDSEWKAIDVILDQQISLAGMAIAEIRELLANGGDEGLLARVKQTISELSHGALH